MKILMTLGLIRDGDRILLGMKKQGFGAGRWNGFGGKVKIDEDESIIDATRREVLEEVGVEVLDFAEVGEINFYFEDKSDQPEVHIFEITKYEGEPAETEEMKPQWFNLEEIPFDQMWPADREWFEQYLAGEKFEGEVFFEDNNSVKSSEIRPVEPNPENEIRTV